MSTEAVISLAALCITVFGSLMGGTAFLTWWLAKEFSATRRAMHSKVDMTAKVLGEKLDYHEAHDDQRFSEVSNGFSQVHGVLANLRVELVAGLADKANRT
jgi:hypothetical protein